MWLAFMRIPLSKRLASLPFAILVPTLCLMLLQKIPEELPFEEKVDQVIQTSSCAIRIGKWVPLRKLCIRLSSVVAHSCSNSVPVRSTSYTHLRDAFIRTLRLRITKSKQMGEVSLDEEDVGLHFSYVVFLA